MRVLFPEWKSFGNEDIAEAFEALGHEVRRVPFDSKGEIHHDDKIEDEYVRQIEEFKADFIFTLNYFPILTQVAKKCDIRYISWLYDNPYVLIYTYTVADSHNIIYLFDHSEYEEFVKGGINTVRYMPLAANAKRLQAMKDFASFEKSKWKNQTDIAFIGSLYNEKHNFYQRLDGISDYTRGYLEGLLTSQSKVYGCSFLKDMLLPEIIEDMKKYLPLEPSPDSVVSTEYLFSQYVLARELTKRERKDYLSAIGNFWNYDLYTPDASVQLPGAINHGPVDYYDMAPYVFKSAKININITLRSIVTGIPLRGFDILGAGGLLLTNYQEDFADCYVDGEDFVSFSSVDDMLGKIDYLLSHEEDRAEIARNGFEKTLQYHTYEKRLEEIISEI